MNIKDMSTAELKFELDLLWDDISGSPYYTAIAERIVAIELELRERNINVK